MEIKYITVIKLSISKDIKYITNIKTIKLLKEKISLHLKNWKYTNSIKIVNNKRLLVTICFANWNIKKMMARALISVRKVRCGVL